MLTLDKDQLEALRSEPTDFSKLDEQTLDPNVSVMTANNPRFAMDSKLFAEFYSKATRNNIKSKAAGRAIFDETIYIRIMVPGDKLNMVHRPATQEDIARFPKQFENFKRGLSQVSGTPISEVGFLGKADIAELKAVNIHTVEQLAGASDGLAQKFMGLQAMKQKAQAYLDAANGNSAIKAQADAQAVLIAELQAQLAKLTASAAPVSAEVTDTYEADIQPASKEAAAAFPQMPKRAK